MSNFALRRPRALGIRASLILLLLALVWLPSGVAAGADSVDEVHYTFTGATSVAFDWRGSATDIRYGPTSSYGETATAQLASPQPFSSPGPFQEVELTGLEAGTTYHYSIGGSADQTFETAPTGTFRFAVTADIGSSHDYTNVVPIQNQIAGDDPDFVLVPGDIAYGYPFGQPSVDQHFNDVMPWSQRAAYMPAWGNHEWESPSVDDLRNYKGRFMLPHAQAMPSAPAPGCCGEDWSWFDVGGVRFISYPEPYASATWSNWLTAVDPVFAAAQNDPSIHFIVTFGHRPAYSTGFHAGSPDLATVLNTLGDRYSKYQLNLNGHSHDYERFQPIHGVTHVTTGGGGSALEPPWSGTDSRTVFRAMHQEYLRVDASTTGMRVDAVCGPPTSQDDIACVQGSVIDSFTLGTDPPPPPPPPPTLYVDKSDPNCLDGGAGTEAQPFCSIRPAAQRVQAGQTVRVGAGTYQEQVTVSSSGTAAAPVNFVAAPGAHPTITQSSNAGDKYGFYLVNLSYVTIQGFTVTGTRSDAIVLKNSTHITLRGNNVSLAGQPTSTLQAKGIRVEGATDSVIATNKVHDNTYYGIYLFSGATRNQVIGNEVYANASQWTRQASGIRLYQATANTIVNNVTHDNEDSGIESFSTASNNLIANNLTYGNGDHGIDNNASPSQRVISNTVYDNATAGINAEGGSQGITIANNVSVDNGVGSTRTKSNIRVDGTSTTGSSVDYDLVNLSAPGVMMIWGSTSYSTLTAFVAATGKETHGIQADPRWVDPGDGGFELRAGSPAIDSANAGASGETATDAHDNSRLDDPATPNTGAGARRYDDRGALEYQLEEVVDSPPNATLSVTPPAGTAPLQVTADASGSTDTDATPVDRYRFDFGDGTTTSAQSSPTATHTYQAVGIYTVTVTVTDRAGLASTATSTVQVNNPLDAPPAAVLVANPGSGTTPLAVTADASGSTDTDSTGIADYRFDFGDGTVTAVQPAPTASHTYSAPGTYTITVTVRDTAGLSSTATTQVTVNPPPDAPPASSLTLSAASGMAPLAITADASASTDGDATPIATFDFDFGDGDATGPQAGATAGHTYLFAGTYTVTVTVIDTAGLSSIATQQVAVDPADTPPSAALSVSPLSGFAPLNVTADASASSDSDTHPISTYAFDFGDGTVTGAQAAATAAHQYVSAGTYTVTVTVTDTAGLSSTASRQVSVAAPDAPPSASVAVSPHSGTAPLDVTADASASTDTDATPIASYRFDFGDGTAAVGPQAGPTAGHTYTAAGTFTVTVTVTDTGGLSSTATTQVSVAARDLPPAVSLRVTPSSGLAPLQVTADASGSTDTDAWPIDRYKFEWGDGSAATGPQAAATAGHTYPAGTYTVKVTVTDTAGLSSTITVQVTSYANFVGNSGFETDLSGWNTSGGGTGITLTRSTTTAHGASASAKLTNAGTAASTILLNDSPDWAKPTAAGTYTGTLWVRADSPGASLKLRFREYAGSTLVATDQSAITLSTAWQPVTVTHTTVSPGSTLDFNAYITSAPAGSSFYADDASIYLGTS